MNDTVRKGGKGRSELLQKIIQNGEYRLPSEEEEKELKSKKLPLFYHLNK